CSVHMLPALVPNIMVVWRPFHRPKTPKRGTRLPCRMSLPDGRSIGSSGKAGVRRPANRPHPKQTVGRPMRAAPLFDCLPVTCLSDSLAEAHGLAVHDHGVQQS